MVWFKVDDGLHSHPKAAAASLTALGLWAVAGSWASDHLTNGDIPEHMIPSLSRGAIELADELVSCGLWRRTRTGYRFHQWSSDSDGTKRNPSRKEVEEERRKKSEAGRKGGLASGKTRSKNEAGASASALAGAWDLVEPPTRPDLESSTNSLPRGEPDGFAEFWATYPPRQNSSKSDARTAYAAALKKGANPADILAGARVYANDQRGKDPQYTAHARTWLHGRRWEDALATPAPAPRAKFAWEN
jgi:hypothetical protein